MARFLACWPALLLLASPSARAEAPIEFYEKKIRPMLVEHCYKCHSDDAEKAKKLKGGLKLDNRDGMMKGGDSGASIVPGKPAESLLLKTLHYTGDTQMPPSGKLPDAIIKDVEKWIAEGAAAPTANTSVMTASTIDLAKGREFWAFQKPQVPALPAVKTANWAKTPIDRFILAQLESQGLAPSAPADRQTLLRRLSFDLTGLPPTPEQVAALERDSSPAAWNMVIDELIASPRFGERWARPWLDVARYAEDQAHTFAVKPKTQAWRYRDWVIRAFNTDMPYDQFVRLQLAGDLMPEDKSLSIEDKLAGLGLLSLGAEYYKNTAKEQAIADELDDRVDTVTRGFLGLTVSCARCHDHKFDPIPQVDYYSIAGIFNGTNMTDAPLVDAATFKKFRDAEAAHKKLNDQLNKAKAAANKEPKNQKLADEVKKLTTETEAAKKAIPPAPPVVHAVSGGGTGMKVYIRGNPLKPGDPAPKGFLQVLATNSNQPSDPKAYTRLDLANAIASRDNPLTARVIVNRIWQTYFGRGLVNTPSNFGTLGGKPSHPELLDYLAAELMNHGWSLKWLHKQIVTSAVYQQGHSRNSTHEAKDADNVFLWRANRKRLDVEFWRDTVLSVAGNLDPEMGGPTFDLKNPSIRKRTIYAKISRHELNGLLRLFDFPDANVTADRRTNTTVPQQQLFVLNSEFMIQQARTFAERIEKSGKTDEERITQAYQLAFTRKPTPQELEMGLRFLKLPQDPQDQMTRKQQYAQVLLASNELMYVD